MLFALAGLTALAWFYLLRLGDEAAMASMASHDMAMSNMDGSRGQLWSAAELGLLFVMWAVMMVGMMTPAVAPMVLLYARVGRKAAAGGQPFVGAGWFLSGYLIAWILFAAVATLAHAGLAAASLLTPAMTPANPVIGAALLVVAGLYQWTPLKETCVVQCRAPLQFIQRHGGFRGDLASAVSLGLRHGLYCVGCCWALMLLLFLGGAMSLLWIAALAAVALAEKLMGGKVFSRIAGTAMILAGIALIIRAA